LKEIANIQIIDDNLIYISSELYYKNLMNKLQQKGILNQDKVQQIQLELLELLSKQVMKYNSGESSSVMAEKATQILNSIYYSMGIYLKTLDINKQIEKINKDRVEQIYQQGIDRMKVKVLEAKRLLDSIQNDAIITINKAYQDTLFSGLPAFFRDYDLKFAAQMDAGSIDYPLLNDITSICGIEYIMEYLIRFNYESTFLKAFDVGIIEKLLRGYSKDYSDLLLNISNIVLTNALGLIILEKEFLGLNILEEDRIHLKKRWDKKKEKEINQDLMKAYDVLCLKLGLNDLKQISYLKGMIHPLSSCIVNNLEINHLDTIFITQLNDFKETGPVYEEGNLMSDEDLRNFIEEMRNCRFVSDKISMIKEQVQSLSDLIEIMKECIHGDEYQKVFLLLSDTELSVLGHYLKMEQLNNEFYYVYEQTELHYEYTKFINNLDVKRKQLIEYEMSKI
jgi:hypothetical protein